MIHAFLSLSLPTQKKKETKEEEEEGRRVTRYGGPGIFIIIPRLPSPPSLLYIQSSPFVIIHRIRTCLGFHSYKLKIIIINY